MTKVLYVTSSPRAGSYSNSVADKVIAELKKSHPGASVTTRDLARDPLPHIDADFLQATRSADGPQTDAQRAIARALRRAGRELFAADVIVIAAPMYNFSIPSTLKAWIDHIARPGADLQLFGEGARRPGEGQARHHHQCQGRDLFQRPGAGARTSEHLSARRARIFRHHRCRGDRCRRRRSQPRGGDESRRTRPCLRQTRRAARAA